MNQKNKSMETFKSILWIGASLLLASSCTKDFEEVNTHPNNLQDITAGSPLNPVVYEIAVRNATQMRTNGAPIAQMVIRSDALNFAPFLYDFDPNIGNTVWTTSYRWLNNLREMEMAAIRDEKPNYEAIALTLKAYVFSILTDCFGDVPMGEALQAEEEIWYPAFTPQQEVYETLLSDLERANSLYDPEEGMIYAADILYGNDVLKWQKFTNSLHMRLLLRISGRAETGAFDKIAAMLNDPEQYPVFESNEDGAVLHITGMPPLLSPWDRPQDFNVFRHCTGFFIDNLNDFKDPRLDRFATKARGQDGQDYGYIGQPINFIKEPLHDSIANPSGIQQSLAVEPLIVPLLSYAELEFIKAEMAQRGYTAGDAGEHYENGVKAAIELWDLEVPEDYFDNEYAGYNGTLARIMLQKYYALFFTDYQAWFELRRTGLPVLPKAADMKNGGELPARFTYPLGEADLNNEHYQEAVARMGGDEIDVKVWWQP